MALTDATLPYAIRLADRGFNALREDARLARGVSIHQGHICYRPVAEDLGLMEKYAEFSKLVADMQVRPVRCIVCAQGQSAQ
jgi:alanine dehydrogenase